MDIKFKALRESRVNALETGSGLRLFLIVLVGGTLGGVPQNLYAQEPGSKFKLYDLNNSVNSYMYYVKEQVINGKMTHQWAQSKNEANENWSIPLEEHNLVMAEEVQGSDGNYYLRIPYGGGGEQKAGADEETPYFLIPQFSTKERIVNGQLTKSNYQVAYPGKKGMGALFTGREDNIVYPNTSYKTALPLAQDPQDFMHDCVEEAKAGKCVKGPDSQAELKVTDTKILITKASDNKKEYMQLYYKVESSYKKKVCTAAGCTDQKVNVSGWTPVGNVIDFKREPANIDETVSTASRAAKLIKKNNEKKMMQLKKDDCPEGKTYFDYWPEDIALVLNQASQYSVNMEDIGTCLGRDHIKKMNDSDNNVQNKYQKKLDEANKMSSKNYSAILKLEHQKNQERLEKLGQLWKESDTPFDFYLRKHWDKKFKDSGAHKSITKDQMLSIDALARTLYGEMREAECSGDTSSYYKEITRVLLNRAALVKKKGGVVEKFISPESLNKIGNPANASLFKILPHVISSEAQISSWNTNDDNLRNNLCPDPQGNGNSAAWELAKAVALEAVLNTKNFLDETKNLSSALFYASKIRPYWEDHPDYVKYGEVNIKLNLADPANNSIKVFNQDVYNPNCVKLYKNKKYLESINEIKKTPHKYYSDNFLKSFPRASYQ
ncbi:MAG: hypothetical protein ACXVCE_11685 [Bacteriovorax sp.]